MTSCPSNEQLAALLDERLDTEALAVVDAHLESCADCQESLEKLTEARLSDLDWSQANEPAKPGAGSVENRPADWLFDSSLQVEHDSRRKRQILDRSSRQPSSLHCSVPDEIELANRTDETAAWPPEVDGYDIVGRLGRGGMGVVYRARQRGLDRLVALKMLRGGVHADPESRARFRIEVQSVARLRHPNVVQVFDVGESRRLPFVALELLEGGSLDARNGGNPQPERDAAVLVATLARAIASAHQEGIVHRDLKPANILFSRDGVPKVTDFGLAKRLDENDGQTHSGQVMGSPSFMAPEQARGEGSEIGRAVDIYSLGAILYEMLTGRPPFKGGSALETLHQVLHLEPVNPAKLRPELARDLETICLKCLRKEPSQRYATALDLAADLDRFVAGAPIQARRTRALERGWKWARREPAAAALLVAASLAGVTVLGAGVVAVETARFHQVHLGQIRIRAVRDQQTAAEAMRLQRWDAGRNALNQTLPDLIKEADLAELRAKTEGLLAQIDQGVAADQNRDRFLHLARLAHLADAAWLLASGPDRVESDPLPVREAAEAALALVGRLKRDPGSGPPDWQPAAPAQSLSSDDQAVIDRTTRGLLLLWAEAVSHPAPREARDAGARQALAILDGTPMIPADSKAAALLRARLLDRLGQPAAADHARRQASELAPRDSSDHRAAGRASALAGDWPAAIAALEAALQLDPNQFAAQLELALAELRAGRPEAARAGFTVCLQREPRAIALYLLRGMSIGQAASRRWQEARARRDESGRRDADRLFQAADADFQTALDLNPNSREQAILFLNRGTVRVLGRQFIPAEADFAHAVAIDPDRIEARVNWGQTLRRLGRIDAALDQFGHAITLDPSNPRLWSERALTRVDSQNRPDTQAIETAIDDLSHAIRLGPPDAPATADTDAHRARLFHRLGRFPAALADANEALRIVPDHAEAALVRIQTLLELKRYGEVVQGCDDALVRRPNVAELWELRGLARSFRQDFAEAVADFTQALSLDPDRQSARVKRGWAYLLSDAARLALADFNAVIARNPEHGEAIGCRGFVLAAMGQYVSAVTDAETSLRLASQADPRTYYNAARIYARSATGVLTVPIARRPFNAITLADEYQDRALSLIQTALDRLPAAQRPAFYRDVIQTDPALATIRLRPQFARVGSALGHPTQ